MLIIRGADYKYASFGIPTFHVFLSTFTCFYSVYLFHQYLSNKNRKILWYTFYTFIPHILVFSRGALLMVWISILFVFLLSIKRLKLKWLLSILILIFIILFLFGYLGNLRSLSDNTFVPKISRASTNFLQSKVPNEYFWGYAYIASPLANFQHNVNTNVPDPSFSDFLYFVKNDLVFDFISNRIPYTYTIKINQVLRHFNVSTEFTSPYCSIGWLGPIILFLFGSIIAFFYLMFLPCNSRFYISALSILLTIFVFNTFANMWTFSGLSLQLVYPVLGSMLRKKHESSDCNCFI
jgi:hypothetical protein